ncbi:MAG: endopeptidase La [Oscillospiraceae bacterium]|jgi:ATP-dependent Lon protease|nr:endopeptidase La [Oscillospiraceae bacterium]
MKRNDNLERIPTLPARGIVVFPGMILHFDVGRDKSIDALKAATSGDKRVFIVTQKEGGAFEPTSDDLYKVGVIAEVRQIVKTPDGNTRVLVEGITRAKLIEITETNPYYVCAVAPSPVKNDAAAESTETAALSRLLKDSFRGYNELAPKMPRELYESIIGEEDLQKLFDLIIFNVYIKLQDKQMLLELNSLKRRVQILIGVMKNEISLLQLELQIAEEVREAVEQNQREFYIREQVRALNRQLGFDSDPAEEAEEYIAVIESLGFEPDVEDKLCREAMRILHLPSSSSELAAIKTYLDTVLELPWKIETKDKIDLVKAQKQLDKDHYGLKKVKERVVELLAVRALNPDIKAQIICLVGPPGVGKTSVGKSIAKAIGRNYVRVSLGGVRDEAEIRGHRKTYLASMPGRIVNALKQAKSMNPVILLDEIDKMGSDYKGDPASAMLEVLDPEQNNAFIDHYLEIPVDLSKVLFITTANTTDTIPAPLLDRMEVIELGSYTREEKFNIGKKHLLPKQLKEHGEKATNVKVRDDALYSLIDFYTREAGVRKLERKIAALCRKSAKKLIDGETKVVITAADLKEYLGVKKYTPEMIAKENEVGTVNGLAWTSVGGVIMPLEVVVTEGTGKIEITGSLGDVMTESAKIAVTLARVLAAKYGIDPDFHKTKDIHIHAPEGATPKDGPSAGVTMTTALISALSGIPVKKDVAMTGEITLHGKVLPIGGLREKSMAAYKAGIKVVLVPAENVPDIEEIDDIVKEKLTFIPAENIRTVLETALAVDVKKLTPFAKVNTVTEVVKV